MTDSVFFYKKKRHIVCQIQCASCGISVEIRKGKLGIQKYCRACSPRSEEKRLKISQANKGRKFPQQHIQRLRDNLQLWIDKNGHPRLGRKLTKEHNQRLHAPLIGRPLTEAHKSKLSATNKRLGIKPPFTQKSEFHEQRNSAEYKKWRNNVWIRDGFKCKIANDSCSGRIEAHHILGWRDYPELRYVINNGITLCFHHHPRKRSEEKRLSGFLINLLNN